MPKSGANVDAYPARGKPDLGPKGTYIKGCRVKLGVGMVMLHEMRTVS